MNAQKEQLEQALHELWEAKDRVAEEKVHEGAVSEGAHTEYEKAVVCMRQRLKPFSNGDPAAHIWRDSQIDLIPDLCAQKRQADTVSGYGFSQKNVSVEHATVGALDHWSDAMVEIYAHLDHTLPEVEA